MRSHAEPEGARILSSRSHVQEAEALAKETEAFKQFFAELEQEAKRQIPRVTTVVVPVCSSPLAAAIPALNVKSRPTAPPSVKLSQAIAERQVRAHKEQHGGRLFALAMLLIMFAGLTYCASVGPYAAMAKLRSLLTLPTRQGIALTPKISTASESQRANNLPPIGLLKN